MSPVSSEMSGTPHENLWDAKDVAAFLKTSRSWVYQRAEARLIPSIKIGGLLRFEPRAIRRLVLGDGSGTSHSNQS